MSQLLENFPGSPKLRHFIWHAYKGSLATKRVLYQRYYVPSSSCDRCNDGIKSITYALIDCSSTLPVWDQHAARGLLMDDPHSSLSDMFGWLYIM